VKKRIDELTIVECSERVRYLLAVFEVLNP